MRTRMASEPDVTKLNERRTFTRLTEYRVIVAALSYYVLYSADTDVPVAEKLLEKYKGRMDSTLLGAQGKSNVQYPVVQHTGVPTVVPATIGPRELAVLDHAHTEGGRCIKNRYGKKCK